MYIEIAFSLAQCFGIFYIVTIIDNLSRKVGDTLILNYYYNNILYIVINMHRIFIVIIIQDETKEIYKNRNETDILVIVIII